MAKRRTNAEIGRLVRQAIKGKRLKPRRLFGPTIADAFRKPGQKRSAVSTAYLESDMDFLENNHEAATAILEALAPSKRKAVTTVSNNGDRHHDRRGKETIGKSR
jgi:hypothetical protein